MKGGGGVRHGEKLTALLWYGAVAALVWAGVRYALVWLLPFLLALGLAMLLEPLMERARRGLRLKRGFTAAVVTLVLVGGVLAALAAVLVLVGALLAVMQHNGRLLVGERTVSPDGAMTMTVYRTSLLGGGFAVESSSPLPWTTYCRHCRHSSVQLATQRQLDSRVTGIESLQWSADGRYLLLCGVARNTYAPSYVKVWDFTADGEDGAVRELDIDVGILLRLAGYDDPAAPEPALLPCLPGVSQHTFLPNVTLSGVHWIGSGHQLTADYAYDGTDGRCYTGTLSYDVTTQSLSILRQSST